MKDGPAVNKDASRADREYVHDPCYTYMTAYPRAKYRADESLAPNKRPDAIVESSTPMDRYEMNVRSFANQTFASTLTGVGTFSVAAYQPLCSD